MKTYSWHFVSLLWRYQNLGGWIITFGRTLYGPPIISFLISIFLIPYRPIIPFTSCPSIVNYITNQQFARFLGFFKITPVTILITYVSSFVVTFTRYICFFKIKIKRKYALYYQVYIKPWTLILLII